MRCSPALVLALLLAPALAWAAWLPGGNRIGADNGEGFVAAASGPARVVVAWIRPVVSGHSEVRAQAWTAEGDVATGWPSAGVVVGHLAGVYGSLSICDDGAEGAFVTWINYEGIGSSAYLQHVSAAGAVAAGWAAEGLRLSSPYVMAVAHDGAGGALVGCFEYDGNYYDYRVRVQRIDAAGVPAPGWPVEGHVVPNAYDVGLVVDSERHVFVGTGEYDPVSRLPIGMRVQRLDDNAATDPAWPQTGALLTHPNLPMQAKLFPDGAGGVFAGWGDGLVCVDFCPPPLRWAARVLGDGAPDDRWNPRPAGESNAPDGTGGMLLGLANGGRPGAQRLDAGGALMPGWAAGGNAAMTEVVNPYQILVAGDGEGGAFVVWQDYRTGEPRLYASRLDPSGRLAGGWPATGSFVGASHGWLSRVHLVSLGGDVAIALWEESSPSGTLGHLLALRPGEPGPIAELGPVGADVGFGIVQVRPNPAHGPIVAIVELENEGPARVDLVDAAGRVLETQDFSFLWQARGAVRFNLTRSLPPGVYWLRLEQGRRLASRKVVVLE